MSNNAKAAAEAARLENKFGHKTGAIGSATFDMKVVPTGSLALDYALGIGGWPMGHPVEVFGAPDIGKSSVIGLNAIKNAQAMGLLCGIVALEPNFDKAWAIKAGVDPDGLVIARPDHGEDAFEILHDWSSGDVVDFTVFDSIGAITAAGEHEEGAKNKAFGQSGLITGGVKKILTLTWKHNKGLIFLNQQRQDNKSRIPGLYESPGGEAVKHSAAIRVHLKSTGSPFKAKVADEEIIVGRTLVANIKRNKLAEGTGKRAEFDYYQADSENTKVGIDVPKDVVSTAIRTRVIGKAGAYYRHETFPGDKHQFQGKDAMYDWLLDNDEAINKIRSEVLRVMDKKVQEHEEKESAKDKS